MLLDCLIGGFQIFYFTFFSVNMYIFPLTFLQKRPTLVDSLLQFSGGNEEDQNLDSKLMYSHYYHIHKHDYCLH